MEIFLDEDGKQITENEAVSTTHRVIEFDEKPTKAELDEQRTKELKGFVVDNIFMNEDVIKTMAVQFNIADDTETIQWIDINNQVVDFSKVDFGALIKQGSTKVKEIYFKYRQLKDQVA